MEVQPWRQTCAVAFDGVILRPFSSGTDLAAIAPQRTKGAARLVTKSAGGKTRLDVFYQESAAKIRVPESYDGRMEAVLINTSGGLTGGDRIGWEIEAGDNTHVTVTTQACERIYKSSGGHAEVNTILKASANSSLHWLPQETILFDRAALRRTLDVELDHTAEFIALEAVLIGRKAMGEIVETGLFRDRWRVRQSGRLIHAEDVCLSGDIEALVARAPVLGGNQAFATLLYCGNRAEALQPQLRALFGEGSAGTSLWNGKLVVRLVAPEGYDLRKMLIPAISLLRNGDPPPKVWHL
jgi:urease accessory protein